MAAILKLGRQIENPTLSIDGDLIEEQSSKFDPDRIWNDGVLGFFEEVASNKNRPNKQQDE